MRARAISRPKPYLVSYVFAEDALDGLLTGPLGGFDRDDVGGKKPPNARTCRQALQRCQERAPPIAH